MANLNQNAPVSMLLTTKLNTPQLKANLVIRRSLIKHLTEGLQAGTNLFLISAPAGYGKTTLVAEWLNSKSIRHTWLSLDEKDNDPIRFLTYLLAALRKISPKIGQATQSLFGLAELPPVDVLITPLINDLAVLNEKIVMVLDDYHLIKNRYLHDIIQFLLDCGPPFLRLALITREDPPLELPRMRAKGEITEIGASDLRFSEDEAASFLAGTMDLNLENKAVSLLTVLTEGWIVGLQLAALSMRRRAPEEIACFVNNFSGSNQYIIDYLVSEVLDGLPKEVRDFLRRTAVLERLCAPLCEAVTGVEDSRTIIELLERANLFLFPLDDERQWYRYHHLFSDSLRAGLDREEGLAVHKKAAKWYEANGYLEHAITHVIETADYQEATRLIYLAAPEVFITGRFMTLNNWINSLPGDFVNASWELAILKMHILYFMGHIKAMEPYVSICENNPQVHAIALNRGRFYNIRSILANYYEDPRSVQLAKEAKELLEDSEIDYVCALNTYGLALRNAGNLSEAIMVLQEVFRLRRKQGYSFVMMTTLNNLLSMLELNGRLSEAIALGEDVISEMLDHHGQLLPLSKIIYLPLGKLYLETNDLKQALKYSTDGIDICRKLSINQFINVEYLLTLVYDAVGDSQKALTTIRKAIREIDPSLQPLAAFDYTALEAELLLRGGELEAALDWAEHWGLTPDDKPTFLKEQSYLTFVRLLLAQRRFNEAIKLLEYLESSAGAGQRNSRLITVHLLQYLAHHFSENKPESRQHLLQALKLAAPGGYYRPFLNENPVIANSLLEIKDYAPVFITRLLVEFEAVGAIGISTSRFEMTEPLTERELEVLSLVADGLFNKEIAKVLFITPNTVRKHLENIYGKLAVQNRTQAVAKARELNLL